MKLSAQPKKMKTAIGKVSQNKVKKREKVSDSVAGKKKAAVLELACESLDSPIKKKVLSSLKKTPKAASSLQKQTKVSKKADAIQPAISPAKKGQAKKTKNSISSQNGTVASKGRLSLNKSDVEDPEAIKQAVKTKNKKDNTKKSKVVAKKSADFTEAEKVQKPVKSKKLAVKSKSEKPQELKSVDEIKYDKTTCALNDELLLGVCSSTLKVVCNEQEAKEKKELFDSEPKRIYMHFTVFKIPQMPYMNVRCCLPNSIFASDPDVCLIVPDIIRGRKSDAKYAEMMVEYEEKLQETGTKGITQILPFTQMRCEYTPFEMRRRLANTYDLFLCDGRIQGHVVHFLGKIFDEAKKTPVPIHAIQRRKRPFTFSPKLQNEVKEARKKVTLTLHPYGDSYAVPVGHSGMSAELLAENVRTIWNFLEKKLPGSLANIKAAFLKSARSLSVPLYASLNPLKEVPVVDPRRYGEICEDELSTMPGRRVTVHPDGTVIINDNQSKEDLEFFKSIQADRTVELVKRKFESDAKENGTDGSTKRSKKNKAPQIDESDSDSDDDMDVDAAEAAYLANWSEEAALKELEEEINSKNQPKKKKKGAGRKAAAQPKGISKNFSKGNAQNAQKNKSKSKPNPKPKAKAKGRA